VKSYRPLVFVSLAIVAALSLVAGPSRASSPDSGTVSFLHPTVTWTNSAPMNGAAPAVRRITCLIPNNCDDFELTVDRGTDKTASLFLTLKVSDGSAMRIITYAPDCPVSPTSTCYGDAGQKTDFHPVNGKWIIRIACDQCVNASYTMLAILGHAPSAAKKVLSSASIAFQPPAALQGYGVGEPGIATDGKGTYVVVSLTGGPAGAGQYVGGIPTWVSHDYGKTWKFKQYGSLQGGWDTDVAIAPDDGTIYISDLEVAAQQICKSTDHGDTFSGVGPADPLGCTAINVGQVGPSNDRQWIIPDKGGRVYTAYHEFFSNMPLMWRSDNHGDDLFLAGPCGPMITDPTILTNALAPLGGTLFARPVVDDEGTIYAMFTTPTPAETIGALPGNISGTYSQIYLAVSKDGCKTWDDITVYDGEALGSNTVQFGDIFNNLAIDKAGNLYSIVAGYVGASAPMAPTADIFMLTSTDHGTKWSKPKKINTDVGAHMLPGVAAGKDGQLAIGYFRTVNGITNPNDPNGRWTYTIAESSDASKGADSHWIFEDMNNGYIYHPGDICNSGIFCGLPIPGAGTNRNLADFTSGVIGADGCPSFVFQGDSDGPPGNVYVTKQKPACFAGTIQAEPIANPVPKPPKVLGGHVMPATGLADDALAWAGIALMLAASAAVRMLGAGRRRNGI
jgi:hypothetical protein